MTPHQPAIQWLFNNADILLEIGFAVVVFQGIANESVLFVTVGIGCILWMELVKLRVAVTEGGST